MDTETHMGFGFSVVGRLESLYVTNTTACYSCIHLHLVSVNLLRVVTPVQTSAHHP